MTQRVEPGITEVALKPNGVCPAQFQNSLGPVTVILCLFDHCIFGAETLFTEFHGFIDEVKWCLRMDYSQSSLTPDFIGNQEKLPLQLLTSRTRCHRYERGMKELSLLQLPLSFLPLRTKDPLSSSFH